MEIKKLIVCCDGTWNKPKQEQYGVPTPTNVFRIYNAIADTDPDNIRQLKYYHPGVGVEFDLLKKLLGGIMGFGLDKIIKSAYGWLCKHYSEGDEIYIFGFSRGAYTARCLAGMIGACGLLVPDGKLWKNIDKAYAEGYRPKRPSGKRRNRATALSNWSGSGRSSAS